MAMTNEYLLLVALLVAFALAAAAFAVHTQRSNSKDAAQADDHTSPDELQ